MTYKHSGSGTELLLIRRKGSAKYGMNTENVKEVFGNGGSVQAGWVDRPGGCRDAGVVCRHGEQRFVLGTNVFKVWVGKIHAIARGPLFPEANDAVGIRIRKRAKQNTIND